MFVKLEKYNEIKDVVRLMKTKIGNAKSLMEKIDKLKNAEDSELNAWQNNLKDIEDKIEFLDQQMQEPEI